MQMPIKKWERKREILVDESRLEKGELDRDTGSCNTVLLRMDGGTAGSSAGRYDFTYGFFDIFYKKIAFCKKKYFFEPFS